MIWTNRVVINELDFTLPFGDRVLEHGLGLFETLRTWNTKATLLPRHLERLAHSAEVLGIPLSRQALPDAAAIDNLKQHEQIKGDVIARIVLSGGGGGSGSAKRGREGQGGRGGALVWMTCSEIVERPAKGLELVVATPRLNWHDPLARHKTLNYWNRRLLYEQALAQGADDALLLSDDGRVWESSRANLFLIRGRFLITPPLAGPIVPGVMRRVVIEHAASAGLEVQEADLFLDDVDSADEVFLTNAVRGIMPVSRPPGGRLLEAPGPKTRNLNAKLSRTLQTQGLHR